ncbi:hypothetical protein [Paenibacillus periandrae]|uniref:hypothetical protein n=1 Tax=Paenibacillus periandrae TaxID=1761741 RepID=UPI001F0935C5|nr:hypothetical protein [Paenibacillus periandrae]
MVAKVTQNPSSNDSVAVALLCSYPQKWLKKLDINSNLLASLNEVTAYVELFTNDCIEIESVLSTLAAIGLHAYETNNNWNHCIRCGCDSIEVNTGIIEINNGSLFTEDRSKMFRYASIATDPFDALLRYWYIAEHMYDDLIYSNVNNLLQATIRPPRFGRAISELTVEGTCAKETFIKNMSNNSITQLILNVGSSNLITSANAAMSLLLNNISSVSFWNKTTPSSQK